ncbi:O-methyltransferase [Streptomyces mashuensis]|uniref:O-methyltransferase n=1 Tax=Streptomyces mashuensis TaxID=33904 RepID=A0A919EBS4_9ACTN|nr:class I SAM-dependent methyltransferase [Streptomyces mashuensis]GHF34404.1 O-methyltransferase [Streptomyces mashuensis]
MPAFENTPVTPELYAYVLAHNPQPDPVQQGLVETTRALFPDDAVMQIAQTQGPLLAFLVRLTGARHIVEVGTFTGMSSLSMAQALPEDGRLIALDVSEEWTAHAREAWAKAGVADRVELRIGPALESLRAMPAEPHIDLAFLDANKDGYVDYWEELVPRLRPGGLIVVDNVFMFGEVLDTSATSGRGADIRRFNEHAAADERMESVMLTIADGVTLARKKG